MASGTSKFSDGWNYILVEMTETNSNAKTNKSTVHTKLTVVVPHSNTTPAWIDTNVDWLYIPGKAYSYGWLSIPSRAYDQSVVLDQSDVEVSHGSDGKGTYSFTSGVNTSGGGSPSVALSLTLTNLDRNAITISNYTLRDCVSRQLYINFAFNYVPANTWYRLKEVGSESWEKEENAEHELVEWIEWNKHGGSYDSSTKQGYFITKQLKANTTYTVEIKVQREHNDIITTKSDNFFVESSIYIKKSGSWVDGEVYIKKNGTWKKGVVYIKKNGTWKEAG